MENNYEFEKLNFNEIEMDQIIQNSSDFLDLMKKRRTTRDLSDKPIDKQVLINIIKTAATAPSGANIQPWTFCLITSEKYKKLIREEAEKIEKLNYEKLFSDQKKIDIEFTGLDYQKEFLTESPALIAVFKHKYRIENDKQIQNYYPNESIGLALGILLTSIHHAGLATIPYTPTPMTFLKKILDRPSYESPVMILPVAFPKKEAQIPKITKKDFDEICVEY
jgi:nitroreductase